MASPWAAHCVSADTLPPAQIVLHLLANVDKILVGFLLGRKALGFYSQAFTVMMKPVVVLTTPLEQRDAAGAVAQRSRPPSITARSCWRFSDCWRWPAFRPASD